MFDSSLLSNLLLKRVRPVFLAFCQVADPIISQAQIYETLTSMNGQVNHNTLAFIRRASEALDKWWRDCDELHRPSQSFPYLPR